MRKATVILICIGFILSAVGLVIQASPSTGWFSISDEEARAWATFTAVTFISTGCIVLIYILTMPTSPSKE